MEAVIAGNHASPLYRQTSAAMECRWRLVGLGVEPAPLTIAEEREAIDLAVTGAGTGMVAALGTILSEEPVLWTTARIARTITGPALELRQTDQGARVRLGGGLRQGRAELARIEEIDRETPIGPRPPTLRSGTGIHLVQRELPDGTITVVPAWTAWLQSSALGLDALRLQAQVGRADGPGWSTQWVAGFRQSLHPMVALQGELKGAGVQPLPTRIRAGLIWRPLARSDWRLRTGVAVPLGPGDPASIELRLVQNLDWRMPLRQDSWPLVEERPGWGRAPLELPDRRPLNLSPLLETPAERDLDPAGPKDAAPGAHDPHSR